MFRLYKCSYRQAGYKILNKKTIKIQYNLKVGMRSRLYINVQHKKFESI